MTDNLVYQTLPSEHGDTVPKQAQSMYDSKLNIHLATSLRQNAGSMNYDNLDETTPEEKPSVEE